MVDERQIDPFAPDFVEALVELLGPEYERRPIGVKGTGRLGHWLTNGVIVVSQGDRSEFVCLYVCFEKDTVPYPDIIAEVAPFSGELNASGIVLRGGESEKMVRAMRGVSGIAGVLAADDGDLHLQFLLQKALDRFGRRRKGPRKLVQASASWGELKGFPVRQGTAS